MFYTLIATAAETAPEPAPQSPFLSFMPFIFLILILYFLMIRPQQKRQKEHQRLVEELKIGDEVMTNGGIVGKITNFRKEKDTIVIKVEDSKLEIRRSFIADVIRDKDKELKNEPTK